MTQPTLTVELGYLSGWTLGESLLGTDTYLATVSYDQDISDLVRSVSIRRGRQHELNRVEAGTASVMVLNQDGAMTRIPPMTAIRIRAMFEEAVPFSPDDIAGLVAWYDFSDVATLWQDTARTSAITADAQTIKGVTDKTGLGRHASEATNGPTYKTAIQNGLSVSRFDSVNDLLGAADHASIEMDTDSTVFLVVKLAAAAISNGFLSKSNGASPGAYFLTMDASGKPVLDRPFVEAGVAATTTVGTTNFRIVGVKVSGTAVSHNLDGSANGTDTLAVGTPTSTNLVLGAYNTPANFLAGDIGEVLIYNAALSTADMNLIGAYLGTKWNITWTGL